MNHNSHTVDAGEVSHTLYKTVTDTWRGSTERKTIMEHGILCAPVLCKKDDTNIFQDVDMEDDRHSTLVAWINKEPSESAAKSDEPNRPY